MQDDAETARAEKLIPTVARAPFGFHHHSWVVADHERTRAFYEDMLGIPLIAFWIERDVFDTDEIVMGHAFYGLQDGSRLSFFSFEKAAHQERFKSPKTAMFNHVALHIDDETQARYRDILQEAGLATFSLDHGYCRSLYTTDPDGLRLEFAVDSPLLGEINAEQRETAPASLRNWLRGDHASNNRWAPKSGHRRS